LLPDSFRSCVEADILALCALRCMYCMGSSSTKLMLIMH